MISSDSPAPPTNFLPSAIRLLRPSDHPDLLHLSTSGQKSTASAPSRAHSPIYQIQLRLWSGPRVPGDRRRSRVWTLTILHEITPCSLCSTRPTGVPAPAREGSRRRLRLEIGFRSGRGEILDKVESCSAEVSFLRFRCEC